MIAIDASERADSNMKQHYNPKSEIRILTSASELMG
eukprot:CAMPEP_0178650782 /NCGR_PEP_ID=MMETSP0698-20121128/21749_1 /TAXON_ID=265572 /ORGANISM="Extubocellulus spinifer, Strain CCMP396" /LENGTH=35 /DNA_ID= /DNA_START= /DNA_END= /DNA_ORIENTATION=